MPRGRRPLPYALLDNKTRRLTKAELRARESAQMKGLPPLSDPPDGMSPLALKEWKRIVAIHDQLPIKVLCALDEFMLLAYCESVAVYKIAQREYAKLLKEGDNTRSGLQIINSYRRIMRSEMASYTKLAKQLYLPEIIKKQKQIAAERKRYADDPMYAFLTKYYP